MELHPLVRSPNVLRGSLVRVGTNCKDGGGEMREGEGKN